MNILVAVFCVALFSLTVPFTRLAALETTPETIIFLRLFGAGLLCIVMAIKDGWIPPRESYRGIICTALGSVIGFSSFTAFAMKEVPGGHAAVALATMPIVTAAYATLRDGVRPSFKFWIFAFTGTLVSFSTFFSGSVHQLVRGDLYLVLAVICAAFGYVEGGRTSRIFGGRRVMSWAILVTLPLAIPLAAIIFINHPVSLQLSTGSWFSLTYLALVSQSSGMFLWFKVLAQGPMEKIALVQLLQPFFTLLGSMILLQETIHASTWMIALIVAGCVMGANRERLKAPMIKAED